MKNCIRFATAVVFLAGTISTSHAATKYWDLNGAADGAGSATPTGTWNTTVTNTVWNLDPEGDGDTGGTVAWTAGDAAVFAAGTDATDAYTVTVSGTQNTSGITVQEGTVTLSGGTIQLVNGTNIDIASGLTTTIASNLTTANGNVITKIGDGTLILGANNGGNFAGTFVLNSGTVGIGNNGSFGSNTNNSTLIINGGNLSNNTNAERMLSANLETFFDGNFSVDNSLNVGPVSFDGVVTIRNSNRTFNIGSGAVLDLQNTVGEDAPGRTVTKIGAGTLRFESSTTEAAASFTGDVTVNEGRIEVSGAGIIGNSNTPPKIIFSGGSLNTTADRSAPIANPLEFTTATAITTTSNGGTVDADFTTGNIVGTSQLTFRNDRTTAGSGTFEPRFSYSAGDLTFDMPIVIDNGNGLTRLSNFNLEGSKYTYNGVISGSGAFRRSASTDQAGGVTEFTAANTYEGQTSVNSGTLLVNNTSGSGTGTGPVVLGTSASDSTFIARLGGNGSVGGSVIVNYNGIIAPGNNVGELTVGDITLQAGAVSGTQATLEFELGSIGSSDLLTVETANGLTINAARFNIAAVAGFGAGTYTLIDYDGLAFGAAMGDNDLNELLGTTPAGFTYNLFNNDSVDVTAIQLEVISAATDFAGDYNDDGIVDAADFVMWRHAEANPDFNLANDSVNPGFDPGDDLVWEANFGNEEGGGSSQGGGAAPEPSTFALAILGLALAGARRAQRA